MKDNITHYTRSERRFKKAHFGKEPKSKTAIAHTSYGNNKYWKARRNRATANARRVKYEDKFATDHEDLVTYAAWEAHIDTLAKENA